MNISTGGPHILLFERDQQLAPLMVSEFQLAGYECHVARTAVEVFDAIARIPIRLVLVDLAQAAASRREFWVALDTQRRGRGVQVFTFQCTNLAGYGAQMPEDRTPAMADMHIDGMLGLMNLVEAVRARVPGGATTSTMPRTPKVVSASPPASPPTPGNNLAIAPTLHGTSGSYALPRASMTGESRAVRAGIASPSSTPTTSSTPGAPAAPTPVATTLPQPQVLSSTPTSTTAAAAAENEHAGQGQQAYQTFTDKIHAVLYPTPRARVNTPSPIETERPTYQTSTSASTAQTAPSSDLSTLQRLAGSESGLAQLSRMVQESRPAPAAPAQARTDRTDHSAPTSDDVQANEQISMQPLRASPIQDLPTQPVDRASHGQTGEQTGSSSENTQPFTPASAGVTPLASIASAAASAPKSPMPPAPQSETTGKQEQAAAEAQSAAVSEPQIEEVEDIDLPYEQVELALSLTQDMRTSTETNVGESVAANNALLLDIVQSLPPMPSPPPSPQPQTLNGRATRSLGSVLLEGHLVPQSRLEVAQGIQRMLRGVDLNYQLGEILLMFKLLTPDQLLAASLVSYGMITTQQIASLGRIRQELHSIGLEYDLENLLILFRILTAEQLREVRSSWS